MNYPNFLPKESLSPHQLIKYFKADKLFRKADYRTKKILHLKTTAYSYFIEI